MNITSENPFGDFRRECTLTLVAALGRYCRADEAASLRALQVFKDVLSHPVGETAVPISLTIPSSLDFGDLASSICLEASSKLKTLPQRVAEQIVQNIDLSKKCLVKSVNSAGGYINFHADNPKLAQLTLESAKLFAESYGYIAAASPETIIVEHTSVNPVGPIHVGTARNSILGDSLSRLLRARGHHVSTHFYVDDVGRQIAVLAFGYDLLKKSKPNGKIDHWIGLVYAMTSCVIEIERLKTKLRNLEDRESLRDQANECRLDLDDWVASAAELHDKDQDLFDSLLDGIQRQNRTPEECIATMMKLYERNDPETKKLIREVVELCLAGFRETCDKAGICWDHWDWESDLVWSGAVSDVSNRLRKSQFYTTKDGAIAFDAEAAAEALHLKRRFSVPEEHEIPSLVLSRSDGTTLYSVRDVAYSLWKLRRADKVINVIGVEQSLAQLQIRIAVSVLASVERAENLIHYAYELVALPGYKMSKRRGRYVTLDEMLNEAVNRAFQEVNRKSPTLSPEQKRKISEAVGVGALKYALLEVAPSKQVLFTWDKVLNFEINSAPFIQYAYARACSILEKAEKGVRNPDYSLLRKRIELELVRKIALFPETVMSAADGLTPSLLTGFAHDLALKFNSFYASLPVLKAEPQALRDARLALVNSIRITFENALHLLGIETLERM